MHFCEKGSIGECHLWVHPCFSTGVPCIVCLIWIDIYIYIYIIYICHPQTDCFVVSQFFSVARHVRCFKLGLKPTQLYIRLSIRPLGQQENHVSLGIIRHYVVAFVCLHFALPDTRVLNSFKELCFMQAAAVDESWNHLLVESDAWNADKQRWWMDAGWSGINLGRVTLASGYDV